MHVGYENTRNAVGMLPATVMSLCFLLGGCSSLSGPTSAPLDAPLKVMVGPVILEGPLPRVHKLIPSLTIHHRSLNLWSWLS